MIPTNKGKLQGKANCPLVNVRPEPLPRLPPLLHCQNPSNARTHTDTHLSCFDPSAATTTFHCQNLTVLSALPLAKPVLMIWKGGG